MLSLESGGYSLDCIGIEPAIPWYWENSLRKSWWCTLPSLRMTRRSAICRQSESDTANIKIELPRCLNKSKYEMSSIL